MVKIMENPIKMDDLGVSLFLETPMYKGHEILGSSRYVKNIPFARVFVGEKAEILTHLEDPSMTPGSKLYALLL